MKKAAFWTVSRRLLGRRGRSIPAVRDAALRTSLIALAVALAGSILLPAQSEAQVGGGLTCGWCIQESTVWVFPGSGIIIIEPPEHIFPDGGNECGWDGSDKPRVICSRCGGTSTCHRYWDPGPCHILCGPAGGDVAAALNEVEDALGSGDVRAVASALLDPSAGLAFEFIPEAGRIDIFLACDPDRAYRTIPVLPEARDRLAAAFGGSARTE